MLKNWPLKLLGLAIIVVLGAVCYKAYSIETAKAEIERTPFNQFSGPADAPIVMVEFLDYRCSACRLIHKDLKTLLEKNDDLKIVYRHYPVFGPQSADEAAMALGASTLGKFNEAHEYLISRAQPVKEEDMPEMIRALGMDYEAFLNNWRSPEIGEEIIRNMNDADLLGINSTPTFYINQEPVTVGGSQMPTPRQLQAAIDKARENL